MVIRIVLVDDACDLRRLVGSALEMTGAFDVVGEAGNGREGVDVAAREQPDLVLLDLSMPEMDGLEALPLIRQASPESVVVVFSGFDEIHLGDEARSLGAAAYVEKGVPLNVLAGRLREVYAERVRTAS